MSSSEEVKDKVRQMCEDATRSAIQEIDAEDATKRVSDVQKIAPSPVKADYGDWTPFNPTSSAYAMMWEKYLPATSDRDVSKTQSWQACLPENEDQELRNRHAERVAVWRKYFCTFSRSKIIHEYEGFSPIHVSCKYRYPGSLVNVICPYNTARLTKSAGDVIDVEDIKVDVKGVADVAEAEVADVAMVTEDIPAKVTKKKKKERKRRGLCCWGK